MKTIDISNWSLFSKRPFSNSYVDPSGKFLLKAVDADDEIAVAYLTEEYHVDTVSNTLGIPTAKVFDLVITNNNEIGIIYEFISDKISCSRAISQAPEKLTDYIKTFASVAKKIHTTEADVSLIPPFTSRVFSGIDSTDIFSKKEKETLKERLLLLPTDTKCIHGDLSLSNVIHSPSGDYAIDLGLLSYGNPLFDIAYFYYLVKYLPKNLIISFFHFDSSMLNKCWAAFVQEYFGTNNICEIEEYIKPYAKFAGLPVLNVANDLPSVIAAKDFILSK